MNYPSGGFPAQGPQYPQQPPYPGGAPYGQQPQPSPRKPLDFELISYLVAAGLGLANFILAFVLFGTGLAWIATLLLTAGLAAVLVILPGEHQPGPWPAVLAVPVVLVLLLLLFRSGAELEFILVFFTGLLQAAAAAGAYLLDAKIITLPEPGSAAPQQPQQPEQPQYPQQPQYPGPQQGWGQQAPQQGYGQPDTPSGGFPAPPQYQQPTTYAPQQGQFQQPPH